MDIYAASEKPIEGVTAEALVERIRQFGHRGAEYVGSMERGVEALLAAARRKATSILTLGAGSVSQAGEKILRAAAGERLRWHARAPRSSGSRWRLWLGIVMLAVIGVSSAMAALKIREYRAGTTRNSTLSRDRQDALAIQGIRYTPRSRVQRVFAADFEHSLFLGSARRAPPPAAGHRLGGRRLRVARLAQPPGGPASASASPWRSCCSAPACC